MDETILRLLARVCRSDEVLLQPDLDLYESGLLDSFGFIELLDAVEAEFGVEIYPTQVRREDTQTPHKTLALVKFWVEH